MSTQTTERGQRSHDRATPLLAVDGVMLEGDTGATASKLVRADDPYLKGHYPSFALYPGAFVIESVAQTHRAACAARGLEDPGTVAAVSSARFLIAFFPGDTLVVRTTAEPPAADGSVRVRGRCEKNGALAARVTLVFAGARA